MLPVLCEPGWDPRQRLALGRATQPGPSASAGLHCTRHAQDSPRQVHASWQGKRSPPDSSNRKRKGSPTPITGEEASTSAVHPRGIGWWGDVEREGRCQAKALEITESTLEWPPPPSTGTPLRSSRPRGSGSPHPLQLCFPRSPSLKSRSDVLPPQPYSPLAQGGYCSPRFQARPSGPGLAPL